MKTAPTLHTERLILRSFTPEDAADVQKLANDPDMASTTDEIEYPYEDGKAEEWIQWCQKCFANGERVNFAVTLRTDGTLIGKVSLLFLVHLARKSAELGYWIGKPYWNCGYATEAAKAVVAYGFREHDVDLIYAYYFKRNPASGRVLEKIGMRYVEYIPKDPKRHFFEDTIQCRILKCEFKKMRSAPPLLTERLILRSFTLEDAPHVQRLAGDRDIASTLTNMPHPYEDGMAEEWMRACSDKFEKDEALNFAITLRTEKNLIGGIELRLDPKNENGELGYWIGKPYWNCGYATEAAGAVVAYGFEVLKLNRLHAKHFKRNPASGRVLEKIGMRYEGCFRQHIKKWDNFEDLMGYGMLKADFDSLAPISSEDI